jgi:hypothetical protein
VGPAPERSRDDARVALDAAARIVAGATISGHNASRYYLER